MVIYDDYVYMKKMWPYDSLLALIRLAVSAGCTLGRVKQIILWP